MSYRSRWACAHSIVIAISLTAGCVARRSGYEAKPATPTRVSSSAGISPSATVTEAAPIPLPPPEPEVATVGFIASSVAIAPEVLDAAEVPSSEVESLSLPHFVQEVLTANRSLQASVAAWRAAAEKYPQAIGLDDPMFTMMTAPGSWSSNDVTPAYLIGASQKISWYGKRSLRGQVAQSEARAASWDVADVRLRLTQVAHLAFFDYYLVERQLELANANVGRLEEFRDTARRQYEAGLVAQQDMLQAEVELAEGERRRIELKRARTTAVARINTLVHRTPEFPLPPPPRELSADQRPAPPELLRQTALQQRPDLAAMAAKIQADRASLALAYKEFYPDFELMGRYDRFWQPTTTQGDLQGQFGVNMNVPIYLEKRRAAAREAMFKLRQQCAEYERQIDEINQEVAAAHAQVVEMSDILRLYQNRTLPAAERNVAAARNDYVANRADFLRVLSAQRQLLMLQEKEQEAIVGYLSRLAELERVVGGALPLESTDQSLPSN